MSWRAWACELLAVAALLSPASAWAQDDELPELPDVTGRCAPEVTGNRRTTMQLDGVDGFWVHGEVMRRCMLGRLRALPEYAARVRLLENQLRISDDRHRSMVRQVELAEEGEQEAAGALEAAERGRRHAEEERDVWYRSPGLWFVLGGVVVAVLVVVGGWALAQVGALTF